MNNAATATGLKELRYFTGYEAANAVVDIRYVLQESAMRYRVASVFCSSFLAVTTLMFSTPQ